MTDHRLSRLFEGHPRLIGAAFTLALVLASTEPVLAAGNVCVPGP